MLLPILHGVVEFFRGDFAPALPSLVHVLICHAWVLVADNRLNVVDDLAGADAHIRLTLAHPRVLHSLAHLIVHLIYQRPVWILLRVLVALAHAEDPVALARADRSLLHAHLQLSVHVLALTLFKGVARVALAPHRVQLLLLGAVTPQLGLLPHHGDGLDIFARRGPHHASVRLDAVAGQRVGPNEGVRLPDCFTDPHFVVLAAQRIAHVY